MTISTDKPYQCACIVPHHKNEQITPIKRQKSLKNYQFVSNESSDDSQKNRSTFAARMNKITSQSSKISKVTSG